MNQYSPKLGLAPSGYCVGLANTQAHKNIKIVIDAFHSPEMASHKLVLFGGATKDKFEDEGITVPENVIFAGYVSDEALRSLLENATAMVFPSLTEGFGLPPLEAMLLGTPAICAPCGALPEVCGEVTGYVDPKNAAAWASAIKELIEEPTENRTNRAEAVRKQAAAFTWEGAAKQLANVIVDCQEH